MKTTIKMALIGAVSVMALPIAAHAQWWHQHPGYLRAMSDARMAYALVTHHDPRDPAQAVEESRAANEILAAYNDLKHAAIDDGKNINDQPPADFQWGDHRSRLQRANEMLYSARRDLQAEEDNPAAAGLRDRAIAHLGEASHLVGEAQRVWHF
ncbi:hypothetical protein [Novosphingobium sp. FSW06-99]|uniref:hypothetical protein n=1 Tax=Novosphingobium sp. FSW06-99 TaxID=1739113 RepID=UPI00076BED71|nr:hypothetical protein [Novosphingobium sp. FSW06-99]KUR75128.1 hypothetical protein AQZ49_15960 [Novosphingobium sp. FSW06-99]